MSLHPSRIFTTGPIQGRILQGRAYEDHYPCVHCFVHTCPSGCTRVKVGCLLVHFTAGSSLGDDAEPSLNKFESHLSDFINNPRLSAVPADSFRTVTFRGKEVTSHYAVTFAKDQRSEL
ncbi:hypothetical protein EVAR_62012_1 [Eumeta japonica]|uniref:Uncharacterized protein n=1 Tax=Eumeta variegata TaxID=151549 RepID=A0A4C1ZW56_EUMVA|nr:hypothetical protein EVAR_62012_1 [Eumeta japonica]